MSGEAESELRPSDTSYAFAISKWVDAWDRFWFTPSRPQTVCVLRLLTGAMLLYCHIVLASDLQSFIGPDAWINNEMARQLHDDAFGSSDCGRSYLWHFESSTVIWAHHLVTLTVTAMMMLGAATRLSVPLALFLQLMYLHRLTPALFGLDQIVTYTTFYLAFMPCGARFSIDSWLRSRLGEKRDASPVWRFFLPDDAPSVAANIGTRLLQLHLCVIYMFGGLAKARGVTWWDGTAVWYAVANYEYQSLDMTWLAKYPALIAALSNATLFWEVFYCALVWPRVTRPLVLAVAVGVHGGIALFLGMSTFGLMMIIANAVFVTPALFQSKEQREYDKMLASFEDEDEDSPEDEEYEDLDLLHEVQDDERERLNRKRAKVRDAATRVKRRYRALKKREEKYQSRVKRLREREKKIKDFVKRKKSKGDPAAETDE
ncbi:MAG: HTTM domain-containing protein [Planctomycetota bacterium]